jgi:hypothetical protein
VKYRDPSTGEMLDVDDALDPVILDRLNCIPGITIVETCAGNPEQAYSFAYLAFLAPHARAVAIAASVAMAMVATRIIIRPAPPTRKEPTSCWKATPRRAPSGGRRWSRS